MIKLITQPGYDIHSSPWFFDGPNQNRWFTVLNSMVNLSMAMLVITRGYYLLMDNG
jgi:hypothetical protein